MSGGILLAGNMKKIWGVILSRFAAKNLASIQHEACPIHVPARSFAKGSG